MDVIQKSWDEWSSSRRDPRTESWPLVTSAVPLMVLTVSYLLMARYGPILMRNRKPVDCKTPILVYNAVMVIINAYIAVALIRGMYGASFSVLCQELHYSYDPNHMRIATGIWLYYVSKPIEYLDTLFFVLRKKNDQLTFLHVYHHSSVFVFWWVMVNWGAGGVSVFGPTYNSIVHVVMYSYYGLSAIPACRPFLWWKKYITIFQLAQFLALAGHLISALFIGCAYPQWILYMSMAYVLSMIGLFLKFYFRAYIRKERLPSPTVDKTK